MPNAAIKQPGFSPAPNFQRTVAERHSRSRRVSDIALAEAVAQAVRAVPGVADLSSGLSAPAATYGPGQHVTGIAVRHPTLDTLAIEVHVALSETHCTRAATAAGSGEHDLQWRGPVTEVANQVRGAVYAAVQEMTSLALVRVDVFIDDLR